MKRIFPALCALSLLAACGVPAESAAPAATPSATPAGESAPETTDSSAPTPSPAAVSAPVTTLEEWTAVMPEQKPDFTLEEGTIQLGDFVAWPDEPVTLEIPSWTGTLEEAAEAYGVSLETLQALNPDPESWTNPSDGSVTYYDLKLQDDYVVPEPAVRYVTISTPWVENSDERTDRYMVPAALSDQAAACMAAAYDFQYKHYGMQGGIWPAVYDEASGWYTAGEGALYTTYSDLTCYLEAVYSPEICEEILGGPVAEKNAQEWKPYYQGENDTIVFMDGGRGSNIQYCGSSFTEPELQPDGSIEFWQLSLTVESDGFAGWEEGVTYTPDTVDATIVRLEQTETGWRVAELSLPN